VQLTPLARLWAGRDLGRQSAAALPRWYVPGCAWFQELQQPIPPADGGSSHIASGGRQSVRVSLPTPASGAADRYTLGRLCQLIQVDRFSEVLLKSFRESEMLVHPSCWFRTCCTAS